MKPKRLRGFVIWEGPSVLDGQPVVLIATRGALNKENRKTGRMMQTYIIRSDIGPIEALQTGQDSSVCGKCIHSGKANGGQGTCYVRVDTGPTTVWKAFKRGVYPRLSLAESELQLAGQRVRLGSYGDPVAVPLAVWSGVLGYAFGMTGYTHQWKTPASVGFERYAMASCDTVEETVEAQGKGWRTFTVTPTDGAQPVPYSFLCPASEQAGKKLTCAECLACGGLSSKNKASVYIPVHGVKFKQVRFTNLITIGRTA